MKAKYIKDVKEVDLQVGISQLHYRSTSSQIIFKDSKFSNSYISSNLNEVIRAVLNFLLFFNDKILQAQKAQKEYKALKSTKRHQKAQKTQKHNQTKP